MCVPTKGGAPLKKYLAFDIETAKILPDTVHDILEHRPLGICCAAAVAADIPEPLVWHGRNTDGTPSGQMTRDEVARMVADLRAYSDDGYTITTWNGLSFDFDVIAEESGLAGDCSFLARKHTDMLFHAFCLLGYRVSLQKAADGMGLKGKLAGMCGALAPQAWAAGEHRKVIDYCVQDVRATLELAMEGDRQREFRWMTQQGKLRKIPLPAGWQSVDEALRLPGPDVSWMADPSRRDDFTRWLTATP